MCLAADNILNIDKKIHQKITPKIPHPFSIENEM